MLRTILAFIIAIIAAALVASVIQTQFNLAALSELTLDIDINTRISTIIHDIIHFSPTIAVILLAALLIAFPVAYFLAQRWPSYERWLFMAAGGVGLAVAFSVVDALVPMPTLIAANRTLFGFVLMSLTGVLAGWVFDRLWNPRRYELKEPVA
ncbi:hypothetical protein [Pseudidiomarina salinarum]|uniref:hypothetical protein n=1 Tax=Pseudidiomarina salinarum TaxID=435908 RepID=UPI00068F0DF7|nr:hypothetical protein [Pseudidiomarina salinarum]RUO71448.1 hypothetical protein CWI79_08470 [Pseudidiomarina salinarum]